MWRLIIIFTLLIGGAIALARGLYLQRELTTQLDTGAMGVVRSWIMWSTSDGRELVAWYRQITPWLLGGGSACLLLGTGLALWIKPSEEVAIAAKSSPKARKKRAKKKV